MNQLHRRTVAAVALALSLAVAGPQMAAQTYYGLAAGFTYSGPAPSWDSYTPGFAIQASVGRELARRLSARLDAFTSRFNDSRPTLSCPCPLGASSCCAGYTKPLGLAGLVMSGLVSLTEPGTWVGAYLIAGAGVSYLYQHPTAEGAARPDFAAGGGITIRPASRSTVVLESRYHALVNGPQSPTWVMPVTFGLRF